MPTSGKQRVQQLETVLTKLFGVRLPQKVSVYTFGTGTGTGLRVAEICISTDRGGESWMRSTLCIHTLALLMAAEDFLRTAARVDSDDHGDAYEKLRYVVSQITGR